MFTPEPYGLHVPDGFRLSGSDRAFIKSQVAILRNRLDLADQKSGRRYATLPSGSGTIIVTEVFGITRVTVRAVTQAQRPKLDDLREFTLPVMYSGKFGRIRWNSSDPTDGTTFMPTRQCKLRLAGYDPQRAASLPREIRDDRFKVQLKQPTELLFTDEAMRSSNWKSAQYAYLRTNWYSGSMASLTQLVRGYGSQDPELAKPYEPVVIEFEEDEWYDIRHDLMPYKGEFVKDGEMMYKFFFDDTHGVSFDEHNNPWLVNISRQGVYVMPLPVIPATTTARFRQWCEEVGDDELLHILDTFGAIPTGESFPDRKSPEFAKWVERGFIKRVCDTSDFYSGYRFQNAIGWSFDNRGNAAVNCHRSTHLDGMPIARSYMIVFKLDPIPSVRTDELPTRTELYHKIMSSREGLDAEDTFFKMMYGKIGDIERSLRRYTIGTSHFRLEVDDWIDKKVTVNVNHDVRLEMLSEGYLYYKTYGHRVGLHDPQIKFPSTLPDPITGEYACYSLLLEPSPIEDYAPPCNTPVFAYFADDVLKVVSYFYDPRPFDRPTDTNAPPCQVVGGWTTTTYHGGTDMAGNWYLNEFDERRAIEPQTVVTDVEKEPVGWSPPHMGMIGFPYATGIASRDYIVNTKTVRTTSDYASFDNAVVVPWAFRDGCIYVSKTGEGGGSITTTYGHDANPDPNWYYFHLYNWLTFYITGGFSGNVENMDINKFEPPSVDGRPVYVYASSYDPTRCSDVYEEGGWLSVGNDITDQYYSERSGAVGQRSKVIDENNPRIETKTSRFSFRDTIDLINEIYHGEKYYVMSPDGTMTPPQTMFRTADCNRLGETFYAAVDELGGYDGKNMELNRYWGYTGMVDVGTIYCGFAGVINE